MSAAMTLLAAVILAGLPAAVAAQDLERIPAGESKTIGEIRAHALAELQKRYPESRPGPVRRDAHAKAHGCVKASFEVDAGIPSDLRAGTFFQPALRFKALIRFSNGAFEPGDDTGGDGRGMAVKIIDAEPVAGSPSRGRPPHDILMINHPAFFSRDAADYRAFAEAGGLTGDTGGLLSYFVLGLRIAAARVALAIVNQETPSPLAIQYYSMAPFLYGEGRAVKYSARPCAGSMPPGPASSAKGADYLRQALWSGLAAAPACFELLVQDRKPGMDVEDTVPVWSETASPFRRIGRFDMAAGQASTPEREETCENLSFNPWNSPPEQRPLGGINRLRKVVYEAISGYRQGRNKISPADPAALWDRL